MEARISPTSVQTIKKAIGLLDVPTSEGKAAVLILEAASRPVKSETPTSQTVGPRLLTVKQAADCLACSPRTVSRLLDDGTIKRRYLRPGNAKSLRISITDVEMLTNGMGAINAQA